MHKQWVGCAAENFRKGRPEGFKPEAIVIHIAGGSLESASAVANDPSSSTSSHYAVGRDGRVLQFVEEQDTAFHAGIVVSPKWELIRAGFNPNFYTIGIDHEGRPDDDWTEAQYNACAELVAEVAARWSIPLDNRHIVLHQEIRASKPCPGSKFDREELLRRVSGRTAVEEFVPISGSVEVIGSANIREGAPATSARVVRVAPPHSSVPVSGFTANGERVKGNSSWYRTLEGDYLWAGATTDPQPEPPTDEEPAETVTLLPKTELTGLPCGIDRVDRLCTVPATPAISKGEADRIAVGAIQDLLAGQGFSRLPSLLAADRGKFGSRTADSICEFQSRCGLPKTGEVDHPTLQRLISEPASDPRAAQSYLTLVLGIPFSGMQRVLSLVAQMEGVGRFAALNLNTDKAGLSFGIIQWAQRPGRLTEILLAFQTAASPLFVEIFGEGDAASAHKLVAHVSRANGGVDPKTGVTLDASYNLIAAPWPARFEKAARDKLYQVVQVNVALAAFRQSRKVILRFAPELQSERAVAFMIDVANQFGNRGVENLYRAVKRAGMSEAEVLRAIADESVRRMPERFRAGVHERRNGFLTTEWLTDRPFVDGEEQSGAARAS